MYIDIHVDTYAYVYIYISLSHDKHDNKCVFMYTYMQTYIHSSKYIQTHYYLCSSYIRTVTRIYTYTYDNTYIYLYICVPVLYVYMYMYTYMYMCTCICIPICICAHAYVYVPRASAGEIKSPKLFRLEKKPAATENARRQKKRPQP